MRGRANGHERYFLHVAGSNRGSIIRRPVGHGTPREAAAALRAAVAITLLPDAALILVVVALVDDDAEGAVQ